MVLLRGEFGEHFISSGRLDHAHAYTDKPASIDALENNIDAFIPEIPAEMLERVCQNWTKRMDEAQSRSTFA